MLIFSQLSVVNLDDVKSVKVRVLLETGHGNWQMLSGGLGFTDGSVVKNPLPIQEMWVWSLGQKDALEEEMATHSRILVWKISYTEEPAALQSIGL